MGKFGIVLTAVIIVVLVGAGIYLNMNLKTTDDTLVFIESRMRGGGEFLDYDNAIGVSSIEDIGWWKKDGKWYILFGKLELEFTPKNLQDKEFLAKVKKIGIDIRGNLEEGDLTFYWLGNKLEEWVPL
jgi:hypothetical protein